MPCQHKTFKILFANSSTLELNEEIFQKLVPTVENNKNLSIDLILKQLLNFYNGGANKKVNNNKNSNVTLYEDSQRQLKQGSSSQFQFHQKSSQSCIMNSNEQQTKTNRFASVF